MTMAKEKKQDMKVKTKSQQPPGSPPPTPSPSMTDESLKSTQSVQLDPRDLRLEVPYDNVMSHTAPSSESDDQEEILCNDCRNKSKIVFAEHTFKIDANGRPTHIQLINTVHGPKRVTGSLLQTDRCKRQAAHESFSNSISNRILGKVRAKAQVDRIMANCYLESDEAWNGPARDYLKDSPDSIWKNLQDLCSRARSIFSSESRVLSIESPCQAFGDIHGNLHDLLLYEKLFFPLGVNASLDKLLFLGDYVDRGEYSVECVMMLFALKIQAPDKVFILRGNHEVLGCNQNFSFPVEVRNKFPWDREDRIYNLFHSVFQVLPLAAIIDRSVFCAHGGIPAPTDSTSKFLRIQDLARNCPIPLPNPQVYEPAHQILWNDPINNQELMDITMATQQDSDRGFIKNTKRGTGKMFSEQAVNNFLKGNGLRMILRAHEVVPTGFQIDAGGKVVTLFSCSKYCGTGVNDAAVAFFSYGIIKLAQVDTDVYDLKTVTSRHRTPLTTTK